MSTLGIKIKEFIKPKECYSCGKEFIRFYVDNFSKYWCEKCIEKNHKKIQWKFEIVDRPIQCSWCRSSFTRIFMLVTKSFCEKCFEKWLELGLNCFKPRQRKTKAQKELEKQQERGNFLSNLDHEITISLVKTGNTYYAISLFRGDFLESWFEISLQTNTIRWEKCCILYEKETSVEFPINWDNISLLTDKTKTFYLECKRKYFAETTICNDRIGNLDHFDFMFNTLAEFLKGAKNIQFTGDYKEFRDNYFSKLNKKGVE